MFKKKTEKKENVNVFKGLLPSPDEPKLGGYVHITDTGGFYADKTSPNYHHDLLVELQRFRNIKFS